MTSNDHYLSALKGISTLAIATMLTAAACSTSQGGRNVVGGSASTAGKLTRPSSTITPAPVASTPSVTNPDSFALPIEQYEMTPAQSSTITNARNILAVQCMKRFGFTIAPPAGGRGQGTPFLDRRYGATDPAAAAQWGYHLPTGSGKPSEPNLDAAGMQVLTGSANGMPNATPSGKAAPLVVAGQQVPKGGCMGEATAKLTAGGGTLGEPDIVQQIDHDGYNRSAADPRVTAVFTKWSACMKAKGYTYASPIAAENDARFAGRVASPDEIAVATADVSCKSQNNVVGIWYAVDAAYENAEIDANAQTLAAIKQGNEALLKVVGKVLGAS